MGREILKALFYDEMIASVFFDAGNFSNYLGKII